VLNRITSEGLQGGNLPHKPWSVQVVLDNGKGFFPDFIIGIEGRKSEDGGLLADTKFQFEITQELPKTYAVHPIYGHVPFTTE
jgi:type III restriction enzyme